ncbi:hypothetical protein GKQ77_22895 [Streptomyces sp. BG9H]|uniref:Uncharacterized protein n=1 Tax=Streptomyces anatolicus TaxID=2675858 RepID=A0ABS6YTG9_9ACTN|nr:hypothetical protein [Streptomyces anatolicus]
MEWRDDTSLVRGIRPSGDPPPHDNPGPAGAASPGALSLAGTPAQGRARWSGATTPSYAAYARAEVRHSTTTPGLPGPPVLGR